MAHTSKKAVQRSKRKIHVRKYLAGSAERPRLTVFRSNKHMYAQVIDDDTGRTLASASTLSKEIDAQGKKKDIAKAVGALLAARAKAVGVSKVAFDRNGFKYHGRVAALATGAREAGLEF